VKLAFCFLLAYVLCLMLLQWQKQDMAHYFWANIGYTICLTIYIIILFDGPSLNTLKGIEFQAIAQKMIVYISILNLGYQAFGLVRMCHD